MKKQLLLVLVLLSMVGIGCSSKTETATPPSSDTPVVTTPDTTAPGGGGTDGGLSDSGGGDTVDFTPVSFSLFNSYVGTHPLNSPKNFKLTVDLSDNGSLRYYGEVKISYEDNGQTFTGTFESGEGKNEDIDGLKDNNVMESLYNFWFKKDSKMVFMGVFQDALGSIILVVDKSVDQGDGQGTGYVSGTVYFKNFAQSKATQSPYRKCWFIYDGPYNCRSSELINKSSLTISTAEGYRKLGTFTGLSKTAAFNL